MSGNPRGFDEFFGPCDRFVVFDSCPEECSADGDRRGGVEVVVLGGPPECDTQICEFGGGEAAWRDVFSRYDPE